MKWLGRNRKKRNGPWWKGKPGFCQTCGGREHKHRELLGKHYCECKPDCKCDTGYVPVPEHDFSKDTRYDHAEYGEQPPAEKKEAQQMMITGQEHDAHCLWLIKLKHPHTGCGCRCHADEQ